MSLVFIGFVARLLALSHAADNDDAPLFIRGVERFSVAEGRPHWPGYPVYIGVAKLAAALVGEPAFGLQIVSSAASAVIAWPLAAIVRAWALSLGATPTRAARAGLCAAVLWLVTPMSWVTGSQIISDPLGLLLGVVIVALCIRGEAAGMAGPWMVAAFLGGVTIGVRLVNVSMLAPFLWKAWSARRERWASWRPAVALGAALIGGVVPWLAWLVLQDPAGYIHLGRQHLGGHFTRYGESIWTDSHPLQRPWVALRTLVVYGLGAGTPEGGWARVLAAVGWTVTLAMSARLRPWRGSVTRLIALWAVPHLVYVFLGHDVAYGRYSLSATLVVAMVAGLAGASAKPSALAFPVVTALSVAAVALPIAVHQGRQPPVEYQAARYLARQPGGAVVLGTQADTLLSVYASEFGSRVSFRGRPGGGRLDLAAGRALYVTTVPPGAPGGWVPVAHFCRDPMIEPLIATELWLFRAGTAEPDRPLPACGEER